ncbi:MAG TPA: DUF2783 domain-containing protein [Stellaceae bacterium]|nr:DUF2783 domain-containing protein [Stellaceae bacterium]
MAALRTEPNIADADAFYAELIELHRGLGEEQSRLLDARLILLLANHVGDLQALREAMKIAKEEI